MANGHIVTPTTALIRSAEWLPETDSTIRFSRKSLKRIASIATRIDAVGAVMKVADSPMRRLEALRLLGDLSLEVHNFYRELMNDFRCK